MEPELLELYNKTANFKSMVTDKQKLWQKALSVSFLLIYSVYSCVAIYAFSISSPLLLPVTALALFSIFCCGMSMKLFQAPIIRRDFPKWYINWYKWDHQGMYGETCKAFQEFKMQKQWDQNDEKLVIDEINERIDDSLKLLNGFKSSFKEIFLKILAAVMVSMTAVFRYDINALAKILLLSVILSVLIWLCWNYILFLWNVVLTSNEKLKEIIRILKKNRVDKL